MCIFPTIVLCECKNDYIFMFDPHNIKQKEGKCYTKSFFKKKYGCQFGYHLICPIMSSMRPGV